MGKRLTDFSSQEVSSRFKTLIEGTRLKHTLGPITTKQHTTAQANAVELIQLCLNNNKTRF